MKKINYLILVGVLIGIFLLNFVEATGNLRIVGIMYAPSSLSQTQSDWINSNLDMLITHESLLQYVNGKIPNTKLIVYKTSGWNNNERKVSVCCYSTLNSQHEDWFLHKGTSRIRDPNTPQSEESYWMNYNKQGWIDFSVTDIEGTFNLYNSVNGLFYDAIQVNRGEINNPDEITSNTNLRNALFSMLNNMNGRITKEFWINGAPYTTGYDDYVGGALALGKKLMDNSDGFMDESLGISWGGVWYTNDILETQLSMMDYAKQTNKQIVMSALVRYSTDYESMLTFYMLGQNEYTYFSFNYAGYNYNSFNQWVTSNNAMINKVKSLGTATGTRIKTGDVYKRYFTNGYVEFNMVNHVGRVYLGATPTPTPTPSPTPTPTTSSCTDSDGNNIYIIGTTCKNGVCHTDSCETPTQVYEWTCVNDQIRQTLLTCTSCSDGKCSSTTTPTPTPYPTPTTTPQTKCTDSDGNNIFNKGRVCVGSYCVYDSCETPTQLYELTCVNNLKRQSLMSCPTNYRCSSGKCYYYKPKTTLNSEETNRQVLGNITQWVNNQIDTNMLYESVYQLL